MKDIIKRSYENELMRVIKENGGECEGPEDIWNNLSFLASKMRKYGEERSYLPLPVKKMLAYIIDPEYRIEYSVEKTENYCTVEAFFYWGDKEYASGRGFVKRFASQIFPNNSLTAEERESIFESTVRGQALSRAITDAGIGLQIIGDYFDRSPDEQEEEEGEQTSEQTTKGKLPQIEPQKKVVSSESLNEVTNPEVPSVTGEPATEEEKTVPVVSEPDKPDNDVKKALEQVADMGLYAGFTLGKIYDVNPTNIAWLANNPDSKVSDAARVIALSDPNLTKRLK